MPDTRDERLRRLQAAAQQLLSKVAALLILGGVAGGTALILAPNAPDQLPPYGDDSLGRIAPEAVRLSRDYDIVDPQATERNRQAAVADIRPVYDFDGQLQLEVVSRVSESFAYARTELATLPAAKGAGSRSRAALLESLRNELTGRLQTSIDAKDFVALVDAGFSAPIEQALTSLVRAELSQLIIEERALLPAERERGILVRPLPDGVGEVVTDLDALRDLSGARADVERLAEGLPGDLSLALRRALAHLARGALRPNLVYDAGETAHRRARASEDVTPVVLHLARGEQVLAAGDRIEPRHLLIFDAIRAQAKPVGTSRMRVAVALLSGLICFLCYRLARVSLARRPSRRDALFLAVTLLATLGLAQGEGGLAALMRLGIVSLPGPLGPLAARLTEVDFLAALPYAMPVAAGTVLVRLFLGVELVGLYAVATAMLFGLLRGGSFSLALFALAAGLIAGRRARGVTRPRSLLRVGAFIASTNVGVVLFGALLSGRLLDGQTAVELGAGVIGGLVVTPLVVAALAPVLEALFGYVSDARLAELCNLNHPALKDLIVRAPGTYHHSIVLAGLAELAAEAVGANPLMARAIGLYHDLGKGRAPLMFSENQRGRLDLPSGDDLPELLRRHVPDGVEVGRRYKLPRALLEAIAQHHGTRPVGAWSEGLQGPGTDLRYPGPLPRRRETGIVMLADAAEAQSRRLTAKDLPRVPELVGATVAQIAAEGQLDQCDLKLGDLARIKAALASGIAQAIAARGQEPAPPFERPAPARPITLDLN